MTRYCSEERLVLADQLIWHLACICSLCLRYVAVYGQTLPHQNREMIKLDFGDFRLAIALNHRSTPIMRFLFINKRHVT